MQKTAHYRRVIWFGEAPRPLATVLSECLGKVPEATIPVFSHLSEFDCLIARRATANEPIFLQFIVFEKGAPAAVVSAATAAESIDADTADPPEGKEYIQSQLFCVVQGNDVVWTSHNVPLREGPINLLFAELIESQGSDETKFALQAILDKKAFQQAFQQGIEEIDLGVGDFKPVLESLISPEGIPGFNPLKSLIHQKPSVKEVQAAADIQGRLVLRPGRRWNKPHVKSLLTDMATNVFDQHDDEFVIKTKSGLKLTKKKMSVHTEYEVHGNKQILNPVDCQGKLVSVLNNLRAAGLLE